MTMTAIVSTIAITKGSGVIFRNSLSNRLITVFMPVEIQEQRRTMEQATYYSFRRIPARQVMTNLFCDNSFISPNFHHRKQPPIGFVACQRFRKLSSRPHPIPFRSYQSYFWQNSTRSQDVSEPSHSCPIQIVLRTAEWNWPPSRSCNSSSEKEKDCLSLKIQSSSQRQPASKYKHRSSSTQQRPGQDHLLEFSR